MMMVTTRIMKDDDDSRVMVTLTLTLMQLEAKFVPEEAFDATSMIL